ncbi:ArsR/SmtB family transcription factor [Gimibacter soli]|uniref:Metalloregulator ArsR/SmtB family transcription factor n=1 Tax=Gimibacter soli TaxID=3024400 RepID=A0AAE9XW54_9PROT|nr:metalloregulator ArsR/SmtB family transcription factor [Gimibacter soli]WCL55338.1 metalloregulator ArsR/SmtB family transcription factor [Gimibacter soli]
MPKPDQLPELRERASDVAALLKTMSHPNRLLAVCALIEGEKSVGTIEAETGVKQPTLSRDLARLRAEGLVTARRDSKTVYYSIADIRINLLIDALCNAFGPDADTNE